MGILVSKINQEVQPLRMHHTVGRRADKVDTWLSSPDISRLHAVLEWEAPSWNIRSLGKNPVRLNGKEISLGTIAPLAEGDVINFGRDDKSTWTLTDSAPPKSYLVGLNDVSNDIDLTADVFLPSKDEASLAVYFSSIDQYLYAQNISLTNEQQPIDRLDHGETLTIGQQAWRIHLIGAERTTIIPPPKTYHLSDYEFVFDLSLDEENTQLKLESDQEVIELGERSHHYALMQLARIRAQQASSGLDSKNQGWIDNEELAGQLGVESTHLNILIFRARKQVAESCLLHLDSIELVERRRGKLRFGCPWFKIYKGSQVTHAQNLCNKEVICCTG